MDTPDNHVRIHAGRQELRTRALRIACVCQQQQGILLGYRPGLFKVDCSVPFLTQVRGSFGFFSSRTFKMESWSSALLCENKRWNLHPSFADRRRRPWKWQHRRHHLKCVQEVCVDGNDASTNASHLGSGIYTTVFMDVCLKLDQVAPYIPAGNAENDTLITQVTLAQQKL